MVVTDLAEQPDRVAEPQKPIDAGATRSGSRRLALRVSALLITLAVVPIAASWIQRVADVPARGWYEGSTTSAVGSDFGVFYTAGALAQSGQLDLLYDVEAFQASFADVTGEAPTFESAFANPPILAMLLAPLSLLDWHMAWLAWTLISLGLTLLTARFLGLPRVWWALAAVLLTYPGYLAVASGQLSMLWLTIFSAVFWAVRSGRIRIAGIIAGLLILKPPLLIGLGIWWIRDKRMRPALSAATTTSLTLVAISALVSIDAWLAYPGALTSFAGAYTHPLAQWAQFSPWGFVGTLTPSMPFLGLAVGLAASIIAVFAFSRLVRANPSDRTLLYGASIALTLWVSPHVLAYDWVLLIPVAAALWHAHRDDRASLVIPFAALACAAYWTVVLGGITRDAFGWTLQFSVVVYAVAMGSVFGLWPRSRRSVKPPRRDDVVIDLRDPEKPHVLIGQERTKPALRR